MNEFTGVYTALGVWGCILCIMVILYIGYGRKRDGGAGKRLQELLLLYAIMLFMDVLSRIFTGTVGGAATGILWLSNSMLHCSSYLMLLSYFRYTRHILEGRTKVKAFWGYVFFTIAAIGITGVVLNFSTHHIFSINQFNLYQSGFGSRFFYGIGIVGMLAFAFFLFCHRRELNRFHQILLSTYFVASTMEMLAKAFPGGRDVLSIALTISAMSLFFLSQLEYIDQLEKKNEELLLRERNKHNMEMKLALAQIEPHFLYNVFNTIYYICGTNPQKAQEAISCLSDYMRGNLNALNNGGLIPVAKELEHIKNYVFLEQLRFGDELKIRYDIRAGKFQIPVLSIQALVKNAVKHGVGKKDGGGTVCIVIEEKAAYYEILVSDDGVGFEPGMVTKEKSSQGEIEKVRQQLRHLVNGTLNITSELGYGTKAYIRIPKENGE